MRIAQIAPPWLPIPPSGYGGVERLVSNLTEQLVARGHEVTLFAPVGSQTGGRLINPYPEHVEKNDATKFDDELFYLLSAYLMANEFDIVHDHTQSRVGAALGALLPQKPSVVHTVHMPWTPVRKRLLNKVSNKVAIVAISQSQADANPDISYAAMIEDGIDLDAHPLAKIKNDYLVFVGRCSSEKAPDVALEVARTADLPLILILKRNEPSEWDFFTREVAPRLRSCDIVLEQPPHQDKIRLLQGALATIFPLRWDEPFGQVMVESMACGTPVIAQRRAAAIDFIDDGVTGVLCDTPQQMVDAVQVSRSLSPQACRDHVANRFSLEKMAEQYERLYASLVSQQK